MARRTHQRQRETSGVSCDPRLAYPPIDSDSESVPLARLLDQVALQDAHSHADVEARERIADAILAAGGFEELEATAQRLVEQLPPADLAAIVADWLDEQIAI
jgi:hypothetical protein